MLYNKSQCVTKVTKKAEVWGQMYRQTSNNMSSIIQSVGIKVISIGYLHLRKKAIKLKTPLVTKT